VSGSDLGILSGDSQHFRNPLQHTIHVCHHVIIPEAKHRIACGFKTFRSSCVIRVPRMLTAIPLNDQLRILANKVGNKGFDRRLTPKLCAI
jgi:hypothetical protein